MAEFRISPQPSSKITGRDPRLERTKACVSAILKVTRAGYVPDAVTLRERIDETMFTADVPPETLPRLEEDEEVASVAISRPLDVIE